MEAEESLKVVAEVRGDDRKFIFKRFFFQMPFGWADVVRLLLDSLLHY